MQIYSQILDFKLILVIKLGNKI